MLLREDNQTNRMTENLFLLKEIVTGNWFRSCPVITVFTHQDIFKDKIRRIPISTYFPEYTGSNKYQDAFDFFARKCEEHYKTAAKEFYHVTVSTIDTESVCNAWMDIMMILAQEALQQSLVDCD
mmetsp:Transcript_27702/g.39050  ORF Transcript_27702/g.39050 Transcript_27702/m.39050 type:complete len:125 (+) Transcript_27702:1-375(+)